GISLPDLLEADDGSNIKFGRYDHLCAEALRWTRGRVSAKSSRAAVYGLPSGRSNRKQGGHLSRPSGQRTQPHPLVAPGPVLALSEPPPQPRLHKGFDPPVENSL